MSVIGKNSSLMPDKGFVHVSKFVRRVVSIVIIQMPDRKICVCVCVSVFFHVWVDSDDEWVMDLMQCVMFNWLSAKILRISFLKL